MHGAAQEHNRKFSHLPDLTYNSGSDDEYGDEQSIMTLACGAAQTNVDAHIYAAQVLDDEEEHEGRLSVTAGNWLSQHGGRSATGGETVLPRQNRLFPVWCLPCAVKLPTRVAGKHPHSQGSVASSSARRRAPSAPRGGGSSFSWCSGPPPRRGPTLRIVLWSPTLNIHGQGRLSSQPWGRARSHALSPAGCSPSLREPRGGQTLSLSGLTRGFIGWWNWRSAFYVERRSSSPPRGPAWVTRAQPAERCPLATRTSRGAATLTLAVDAQVHTSLTRQ